jgi:hypothetical protein
MEEGSEGFWTDAKIVTIGYFALKGRTAAGKRWSWRR